MFAGNRVFVEGDASLADQYGAYASYPTDHDPILREHHGDAAWDEAGRIIERYAGPDSEVLDLGCGAGFHVCNLAPRVKRMWGFEQDIALLDVARSRVEKCKLANVTLIEGNNSEASDFAAFPDESLDFAYSLRGPNMTPWLLTKLKPHAVFLQEMFRHYLGLATIFGRSSSAFLPHSPGNPEPLISNYAELGLLPVSVRTFYWEEYFRDADHLETYLCTGDHLSGRAYDKERDRTPLELYARYNTTPKGIRLVMTTKLYVFHQAR